MSLFQRKKDKGPREFDAILIGLCVIGFVLCCVLFILDPAMEAERKASELAYARATARVEPRSQEAVGSVVTKSNSKSFQRLIKDLFELGVQNPTLLLDKIDNEDIFGTNIGADDFVCPADSTDHLDYPDLTNQQSLQAFRTNVEGSFAFYQHLRKAGGTGFCDLANSNLPKGTVPSYYCMPDNRGSLATAPWNSMSYTLDVIKQKKFRVIANEWDTFLSPFLNYTNVIFATTIRHPIDRWYSQYRFEHLEHRDGSKPGDKRQSFLDWYKGCVRYTMGRNYYVKTFLGEVDPVVDDMKKGDFYWTYHKFNRREKLREQQGLPVVSWEEFESALNHFRQFHLILVMEWLATSGPYIEKLLDWKVPPKQVLPHEVQAKRQDKKSKASKDMVSAEEYKYLREQNVFDILFFEIAKRIYAERFSCSKD